MYLEARKDELSETTLSGHKYRIRAFLQWCDEEDVDNLNDLSGRDLYRYRIWRREGQGEDRGEIRPVTLRGQLSTLRSYLRFAEEIDAVPEGLREDVPLPSLTGAQNVSDTTLNPSRVEVILDYLNRYKYASRDHLTLLLMWHTGARVGGIRALDMDDVDVTGENPGLRFRHRPESGTPLKNKAKGERWNAISDSVARVIRNYIEGPRKGIRDDYDRQPLLTTTQGRPSKSTLRSAVYQWTRPCFYGEECPHDRDPDECEATETNLASKCPSARSPHDLRSGRVTAYRRDDVPRRIVSDRLNASESILDEHYDRRTSREKAEQRRDHLPDS